MAHVCNWRHVRTFDNFLRPLFHNPRKIFAPYIKPGMRVMDVGCGAGFAAVGLAEMVGEKGAVFAVDLQPEMLDMVKNRARDKGLDGRITFHRCREDSIDLAETFDFINAFWMVHEVPDTDNFLAEIRSCLNPGGLFFVAEPFFHVSRNRFARMIESAARNGLAEYARPHIRFSRSVVLMPD